MGSTEMDFEDGDSSERTEMANSLALQRKLYFLNEELQKMARELPLEMQQRLPNELLCALAESLVDNTVFKIVNALIDIQHVTEKQLYAQRNTLIESHKVETEKLKRTSNDSTESAIDAVVLKSKQKLQLQEFDKGCVLTLDEKLHDQQNFLEKAGVPGFEVTNDRAKIQVQIRILDFIIRLSDLEMPV